MPKPKTHDLDTYTHPDSTLLIPRAGLAHYDNTQDTPHTYEFDPHISPALNWAGKSENLSFSVPTPSIHRHEYITPHFSINSALKPERQLTLFDDASPYERLQERIRSIEAYKHNENWTNRLIAGDSLVIMNSLLQKEAMHGTVQTAYIDPPYGIKYGSNFQPFVNKKDVKDKSDEDLSTEPEMIKAFRDTWELGIHSYLTYIRNRLLLVRELLADSGSVFVQISDENVHHVREICDEVFGPENFVTTIKFTKTGSIWSSLIASTTDYLVWYAKDKKQVKYRQLYTERKAGDPSLDMYCYVDCDYGTVRRATPEELQSKSFLSMHRNFRYTTLFSEGSTSNSTELVIFKGKKYYPPAGKHWKTTAEGMKRLIESGRIYESGKGLRYKRYLDDFPLMELGDLWDDTGGATDMRYVVQTSTKVIQRCILMTSDPGDLVLDITCGSGTTAYVAEQWGRRWITCDTSRVAIALARQRLMTATYDYYALADDSKGLSGGFKYRTVPHITLKSIANDEPPARETLYDAPEIDGAKIRITGPFSVEGLPAPVVVSPEDAVNLSDNVNDGAKFSDWRSQLLSTGILGRKGERIRFSRVDALDGARCLNAVAETEDGRSAVVCFADETTLMDSRRVYRGLEEAVNMLPRPDIVIFAAFAFDGEAEAIADTITIPGDMKMIRVQMNVDLMTGDLKKNVRTDQSFFLVGQPDVVLEKISSPLPQKKQGRFLQDSRSVALDPKTQAQFSQDSRSVALAPKTQAQFSQDSRSVALDPKTQAQFSQDSRSVALDPKTQGRFLQDSRSVALDPKTQAQFSQDSRSVSLNPKTQAQFSQDSRSVSPDNMDASTSNVGTYRVKVIGFDYYDVKTNEIASGEAENIAMWMLDTDYDGMMLRPTQIFFPMEGRSGGWNRLAKTLKAEIDAERIRQYSGNVSLEFEAKEGQKIAVKIIDDRGIESMKVLEAVK